MWSSPAMTGPDVFQITFNALPATQMAPNGKEKHLVACVTLMLAFFLWWRIRELWKRRSLCQEFRQT